VIASEALKRATMSPANRRNSYKATTSPKTPDGDQRVSPQGLACKGCSLSASIREAYSTVAHRTQAAHELDGGLSAEDKMVSPTSVCQGLVAGLIIITLLSGDPGLSITVNGTAIASQSMHPRLVAASRCLCIVSEVRH
jgi:hypothetical protein